MGVADMGEAAIWSGLSLAVTPAVTALLQPAWGRVADRYGRKLMVERSLASFVVVMSALAFATRPWHVFALRLVQGFFAGYGALTLAMAAESAPRDRLAWAIGTVQTAQRLGPALGPVIGGSVAAIVGLRHAFFVTAGFYAVALVLVFLMYREPRAARTGPGQHDGRPLAFATILRLPDFTLLLVTIFAVQFIDRSFGPILPLHVAAVGVPDSRVALVAGTLFSILAGAGAVGHHLCGRLLRRVCARTMIVSGLALAAAALVPWTTGAAIPILAVGLGAFGVGVGAAMTAAFASAGSLIPPGSHGTAFGLLSGASLAGLAISPAVAGVLGATSLRLVFLLDLAAALILMVVVRRSMRASLASGA
jgi:MFS family permease